MESSHQRFPPNTDIEEVREYMTSKGYFGAPTQPMELWMDGPFAVSGMNALVRLSTYPYRQSYEAKEEVWECAKRIAKALQTHNRPKLFLAWMVGRAWEKGPNWWKPCQYKDIVLLQIASTIGTVPPELI